MISNLPSLIAWNFHICSFITHGTGFWGDSENIPSDRKKFLRFDKTFSKEVILFPQFRADFVVAQRFFV